MRIPMLTMVALLASLGAHEAAAATYYVRKSGNDGNSGTTPAQAWLTVDRAANVAVAGDTIYVGAGTYSGEITPDNDGTAGQPIRFIADSTGAMTGDAGIVLLTSAATDRTVRIETDNYIEFHGFHITSGTQSAVRIADSTGCLFQDCEIYGSLSDGIVASNATFTIRHCILRNNTDCGITILAGSVGTIEDCYLVKNGWTGITLEPGTVSTLTARRVYIYDNLEQGVRCDGGTLTLHNALIRNNTLGGIVFTGAAATTATIWHCTIAYNSSYGVSQAGGSVTLRNSIIANNSGVGLHRSGGTMTHTHNCVHSNSGGNFSGTTQSTGETTADPRFWSSTCLALQDGSPCNNAGTNPGGAVTDDIEGVARPVSGYDMGCYETVPLDFANLEEAYTALDPYAWWRFQEAGGTATDQMGNHHGTYAGGAAGNVTGGPFSAGSKGAQFDGVNDRINLGTVNPSVMAMSFVAWMKADDFDVSNADILAKASGTSTSNYHWSLGTVSSGGQQRLQFRFRAGGTTSTAIASSGGLSTSVWVFVAGVFDGRALIIYKDGVEVGRTTNTGVPDAGTLSAAIGDNPTGNRPFDGVLDEVAIFTRALKPREIAAMYASALKGTLSGSVTVPRLWGIDKDDAQLFSMSNYNSPTTTTTSYGRLKWNNGGSLVNFSNVIEACAIDRQGRMYMISQAAVGSFAPPVLMAFDLEQASTTDPNVVTIIGSVPTSTALRGLAVDPTNGDLYALRHDGWLYILNKQDASIVATVGQISGAGDVVSAGEDLAFDPFGNLHVVDNADDEFYRVNKQNAVILDGISAGGMLGTPQAMAWDHINNKVLIALTDTDVFVVASSDGSGVTVVPGLATAGLTDIEAMGFIPSEGVVGSNSGVRIVRWKEIQ